MARRLEERVPLLSDGEEEEELGEDDLSDIQVLFQHHRDAERAPQAAQTVETGGHPSADLAVATEEDATAGTRKRKHYSGNEMIVAVFVVQFDIRKGERYVLLVTVHTPQLTWLPPGYVCLTAHSNSPEY